jgi:8-oxo-dGTP pyrophosphatase MutT (NUDIX family)
MLEKLSDAIAIVQVDQISLQYLPQPWAFAVERRAEIDAHFARARRELPQLWNGQVLLTHRHRFHDGGFEAAFLQTDFASFMAWRDWGFPEAGVSNCFSMGALRGSDGAWIMGVMGPHTSAAGQIYFPAGTPDPSDIVNESVDLAGSVIREVAEETGLGIGDFTQSDGWYCVIDGRQVALMKVLQAAVPAEDLRRRILDHLARDRMPELADIRVVRSRSDFDAMMPRFVTAFLDRIGFDYQRS